MRIVLFGQAAFGEKVLQALVNRGEEVAGVYTPPDIPGKVNPLKESALQLGIPLFQRQNMRAPEVYEEYVKLKPDLNVMAYVTSILPESILNYPPLGTIQYHPSLLPKHRGGSAINWTIINGETKTGVTIFWPDKGIDTGPILLQKEVEISPDDTVGSLYFNKLFPLGIEAIVESIELIKKGKAPRIPQDESQATYEGLCTEEKAVINWLQPANKIYNLIRGTNPQPGAITYFQGKRFKIFDSELLTGVSEGLPGEITGITGQGIRVSASDGIILIKRVQPEGSAKIGAAEFAEQLGLKVGDRLGE
jgi:methionyl-tRNA formyltransferase